MDVMETASPPQTPPAGEVAVSFVVIVLNGMPLIELVLANLYDHAHEIIVVEGAVAAGLFAANPDGSSTDGTVEAIRAFPDPQGKIRLIQGSWPEKCEMQNKALELATGNYVWLVDADELYRHGDIEAVLEMLRADPDITQVNFIPDNFWKGFDHIFVSPVFFEEPAHYRRVFKYVPGSKFRTHRPPTLYWPGSSLSTEQQKLVDGNTMRNRGIWPYHYSYVFDAQVRQKIELYRRYGWDKNWNVDMQAWYRDFYRRWSPENSQELEKRYPVWTGDPKSYTVPFPGGHPEVVQEYLARHPGLAGRPAVADLPMRHVIQAIQEVLYLFLLERRLLVLETGTIRSYDEHHESTRHISRTLGNRGKLLSVDTSEEAIRISRDICQNAPNVEWILADSLSFLAREPKLRYHFVLLDSLNDAEHIFREFVLVAPQVPEGGIVMVDDAGIHVGGRKFDGSAAQKGHKVWAFLRACRAQYAVLETPCGHGTQLKIVFTKANRDKILSALAAAQAEPDQPAPPKPKIAAHHVPGGVQVDEASDFSRAIDTVFAAHRPRRIIETGTYHGTGTTRTIAAALAKLGLHDAQFYTIEVNPANYRQAIASLTRNRLLRHVRPMLGLSVPRALLPSLAEIEKTAIEDIANLDIFVDHEVTDRVRNYHAETNFQDLPDDLLGACLDEFDNKPDFVLLDSGGHMGFAEFAYLLDRLDGPCLVALDDVHHIKHYKSLQWIKKDPRFRIIRESNEKFGFCIAAFTPAPKASESPPKRILWVRTDSIGDNILALSMLAPLRAKHPQAQIAVVCQEHIAELYAGDSGVDTVIPFNREALLRDAGHQRRITRKIQALKADVAYNSVYSRDQVSDFLTLSSLAPRRVGLEGNLCNITAQDKAHNDKLYTRLIPSQGEWKLELERHQDFLRGIGIETDGLAPHVTVDAENLAFADAVLAEHGLDPARTVVLFCGVQNDVRLYAHYGVALEPICREHGLAVVALGSSRDAQINQDNLDRCRTLTLNLSGATTLKQSLALLQRCRLAVGAETGLAHMACAVSTPNVILLGGGHFGRFMPYSPLTTVVSLPLECYWCNWHCRYERAHCVADVSPEVLGQAIRLTLAGPADRPRAFFQDEAAWPRREGLPRWRSPQRIFFGPPSGQQGCAQSAPPCPCGPTPPAAGADGKEGETIPDPCPEMSTPPCPAAASKPAASPPRPDDFADFAFARRRHWKVFQGLDLDLYGTRVDPDSCDLKRYQDLLVLAFILANVAPGSRLLEVGEGDSRILAHLAGRYECWNVDKFEGLGNGPLQARDDYRVVRDYIGNFNSQLPDAAFDCVFSISALEHTPEDPKVFADVVADIDRLLVPGGLSLHLFDVAFRDDGFWTNSLVPYLGRNRNLAAPVPDPGEMALDPELYVMSREAYEALWRPITRRSYEDFGRPSSVNVLWRKPR
jgi:ADP-heptose:LPS heptosyltransferase/predicted O-methyltransferase YrrM